MELKEKIKEIVEIAASLPDNLQQPCFEILLRHHLASFLPPSPSTTNPGKTPQVAPIPGPDAATDLIKPVEASKGQADLANTDIHVKARRFLEKHGVSLGELNNLFYKEDQQILPLYEDLKTTRMAEAQIRIALLLALRGGLATGDFQVTVDAIRAECRDRKCYDQANFAANFRNNQSLFDAKYTKDTAEVRLSESGRKELAQLVKELQ